MVLYSKITLQKNVPQIQAQPKISGKQLNPTSAKNQNKPKQSSYKLTAKLLVTLLKQLRFLITTTSPQHHKLAKIVFIYLDNLENHPSLDTIEQYAQEISLPNFDFHTVGPDAIVDIIDRLPTGKAPGYDGITGNCIKAVKHTITNPLLCITNRMFTESIFPDPLKCADVTPIYRKM